MFCITHIPHLSKDLQIVLTVDKPLTGRLTVDHAQ